MKSGSNLERILESGQFAATAEIGPPTHADGNVVIEKARMLKGKADAFNITDCQTAVVRLSSIASAIFCLHEGVEPVMQMVCRDRNRIAMQADILGAAAHGVKNCLCIAGDHQSFGAAGRLKGHPGAKNVYDVDSIHLIAILKRMRDEGLTQGGDEIEVRPKMYIGAAWTPMADPVDFRVIRLAKKVKAGADFIQTQGVYDIEAFKESMRQARERGLHEKTHILAGIIVPKASMMLKYMAANVAGVRVPDSLIKRMSDAEDKAPKGDRKAKAALGGEEGIKITVELIQQCREIPGIHGVHIQAIEWEKMVPQIVEKAGLLPRPVLPPLPPEPSAEARKEG
jgi:methylenetetrahydrofolate reductase (NADPH)